MIIDKLTNASLYHGLAPRIAAGLRYLRETDFTKMPAGKYEIAGPELYALVNDYQTKPAKEGSWEAHRRFVDIQYLVSGTERMGYAELDDLEVVEPYDEPRDFIKLKGTGQLVVVRAGAFVLFGPRDAHMPNLALAKPEAVRKVVVKAAVEPPFGP